MKQLSQKQVDEIAEKIVDMVFDGGIRLAIVDTDNDEVPLRGWSRGPITNRVSKILNAELKDFTK